MAKKSVVAGKKPKLPVDIRFSMALRGKLDRSLRDLEVELQKTFALNPGVTSKLEKRWKRVRKAALLVAYGGC